MVHCVPAAQPHARHQPQQQLSHQADAGAAADEAAPASGDGGLAAEQAAQPAEPDQAAAEEEEAVVVEEADEDLGAGDSAATEVPQPEGGTGAELDEEEEEVVEEEGEEEAGPDASEAGEGAAGTGTDSEATAAEEGAGDSQVRLATWAWNAAQPAVGGAGTTLRHAVRGARACRQSKATQTTRSSSGTTSCEDCCLSGCVRLRALPRALQPERENGRSDADESPSGRHSPHVCTALCSALFLDQDLGQRRSVVREPPCERPESHGARLVGRDKHAAVG